MNIISEYWREGEEPAEAGWRRIARIASTPPLRDYIGARILEMTSKWMFRVTTPMLVWQLTHDERMLAAALTCLLLPGLVMELIGGIFADRYDRRTIMVMSSVGSLVCNLVLAVLAMTGALGIGLLLTITVAYGAVNAIAHASSKTFITAFVRREELATAVSLNSVVFNMAGFVGPAVAAGLIYYLGFGASYIGCAVFSLAFVALVLRIPTPHEDGRGGGHHAPGFVLALREGLLHVLAVRLLLLTFILHTVSIALSRPFLEFVPAIVHHAFAGGAGEAGMLFSAFGLGSIAGGLWLGSQNAQTVRLVAVALGAMPVFAAALLGIALSPSLPLAMMFCVIAGFGMITRGSAIQSVMQLESHPAYRGRVVALHGVMFEVGSISGALLIGEVARAISLSVALSACVTLLVVLWLVIRRPLLRTAEERQRSG